MPAGPAPTAPAAPMQPAPVGGGTQQQMMQNQQMLPGQMPTAARLPVGPDIKHVQLRYDDGRVAWIPVEAATEAIARAVVASFMDDTQVLQVVDSLARAAQMQAPQPPPAPGGPPPPMPGGAPGAGGGAPLGVDMTGPGGAQGTEASAVDPQAEEIIRAGIMHFRTTGVPIDEAIKSVSTSYRPLLDHYGDKTSPARHMLGNVITEIAKKVYSEPAPMPTMGKRRQPAPARRADGIPTPKKVNTQQDDWVSVPGGGELLSADQGAGFSDPSVKQQRDMMDNAGTSAPSTDLGEDSSTRDPGDFGAGKGYDGSGHVTFDGPGWGQSWSDTELGPDRAHGHGDSTEMSKTPEITYRSK